MHALVGYIANQAAPLDGGLGPLLDSRIPGKFLEETSMGLGFYDHGEVLRSRLPLSEGEQTPWSRLLRKVNSECVLAYMGLEVASDMRTAQPFRFQDWLCVGRNLNTDAIDLSDAALPDFLKQNRHGVTLEEHVFLHVMASLSRAGLLDAGSHGQPSSMLSALVPTQTMDVLAHTDMILTHGRGLLVWSGLSHCDVLTVDPHVLPVTPRSPEGRQTWIPAPDSRRTVCVLGDMLAQAPGMLRLKKHAWVFIGRDGVITEMPH